MRGFFGRGSVQSGGGSAFAPITATGGDEVVDKTVSGRLYRFHAFTNGSSNFVVSALGSGLNNDLECVIVAGGGGGGRGAAGSGGGGGNLDILTITVAVRSYATSVGARGARATANDTAGGAGGNSTVDLVEGTTTLTGGTGGDATSGDGGSRPGDGNEGEIGTPSTIGGDGGIAYDMLYWCGGATMVPNVSRGLGGGGGGGGATPGVGGKIIDGINDQGGGNGNDGSGSAEDGSSVGGNGGGGNLNGGNGGYGSRGCIIFRYPLEAA